MPDIFDYGEVPLLQDILNFLPINSQDGDDVFHYIQNIANLIAVNYKYEQYQFAYLGIHLLYMTYIYCTAWKIGQIEPQRYKDAIVFARSYSGREKDLKIEDASSIFAYSLMPEKDIAKLFKIIDLDKSSIRDVKNLVDVRDEMAHASGKFEILTIDIFASKVNSILSSMRTISNSMSVLIKKWYSKILSDLCKGLHDEYDNPKDFIEEKMIQAFKLSSNELMICNEMSMKKLISDYRDYKDKLTFFKKTLSDYCQENLIE